jgi:glycosyltransferase involved in cell wall biosynthesis
MTRTQLALLTLGDPGRVTGGYLFHRRLADRAHRYGMAIDFVSVPDIPIPWAMLTGPGWLRHPAMGRADAVVLDSIAAAPAAPWLGHVRVPILGMLHQPLGGMDASRIGRLVRTPLDRLAYHRAEILMVASEWLAAQLAEAGVSRSRLRVVPPGKDPSSAASSDVKHEGERTRDLRRGRAMAGLCVANWLPRKGILELLEAVARLPHELVTLHLVGETTAHGRYARAVRRRLTKPDLRDRVVVHGVVPASAVARMYRSVDAFLLPSFEEPYGTVWGEAMAAGLAVVGWRAGNLPFLADHGREGLLAPVGDVSALSDAIWRIAREPDLCREMGRAAMKRASKRPTWEGTADLFFTIVNEVLDRHRPRARQPGEDP